MKTSYPVYEVRKVRSVSIDQNEFCRNQQEALAIAHKELDGLDRERLLSIYLNGKNAVVGIEIISIGSEIGASTSLTCLFRGAIIAGANAIIVVHNHPSGYVAPSKEDEEMLAKIKEAGKILDCPMLDFIIVADDNKSWSMEYGI